MPTFTCFISDPVVTPCPDGYLLEAVTAECVKIRYPCPTHTETFTLTPPLKFPTMSALEAMIDHFNDGEFILTDDPTINASFQATLDRIQQGPRWQKVYSALPPL